MNNIGIKEAWSLVEFRNKFTKMYLTNEMINTNTGEPFKCLAFKGNDDKVTMVGFSSELGELTSAQIKEQKDSLRVVQLNSGSYKLCGTPANAWEEIDL